jgi:hypothetical protein
MAWDPTVLRKYNTTGHFRLINQVRAELKDNPLVRPKEGQSVGEANRSRSLTRALEGRGPSQRFRRGGSSSQAQVATTPQASVPPSASSPIAGNTEEASESGAAYGFRERLNAIELR